MQSPEDITNFQFVTLSNGLLPVIGSYVVVNYSVVSVQSKPINSPSPSPRSSYSSLYSASGGVTFSGLSEFVLGEDSSIPILCSVLLKTPVGSRVTFDVLCRNAFGTYGIPAFGILPHTLLQFSVELVSAKQPALNQILFDEIKELVTKYKDQGNACIESGDTNSARQHYLSGLSAFSHLTPTHTSTQLDSFVIPLYTNLALCEAKENNINASLDAALSVIRKDPDNGKAHYRCGSAYELCGELQPAIWHFEQSTKSSPSAATLKKVANLKERYCKEKERRQKQNFWGGMFVSGVRKME